MTSLKKQHSFPLKRNIMAKPAEAFWLWVMKLQSTSLLSVGEGLRPSLISGRVKNPPLQKFKTIKTCLRFWTLIITVLICSTSHTHAQTEPLFLSSNPKYQNIRVTRVVSTDTFYLENDETVRLIGLKTPLAPRLKKTERDQFGFVIKETTPYHSLEEQALLFAQNLLEGQLVRLEFDAEIRGKGNILLAYVFLNKDNVFINEEILAQGFANLSLQPPNMKYAKKLRDAYQTSRQEKRGLQGQ